MKILSKKKKSFFFVLRYDNHHHHHKKKLINLGQWLIFCFSVYCSEYMKNNNRQQQQRIWFEQLNFVYQKTENGTRKVKIFCVNILYTFTLQIHSHCLNFSFLCSEWDFFFIFHSQIINDDVNKKIWQKHQKSMDGFSPSISMFCFFFDVVL